jgi:hypothetical protein
MTLPPNAVWAAFGGSVESRGCGALRPVPPLPQPSAQFCRTAGIGMTRLVAPTPIPPPKHDEFAP